MEVGKPIQIHDFDALSPLVKGYELQPDKVYLLIADGKKFSYELAYKLLADVREWHPEIHVCIIAAPDSNKLQLAEKKSDELIPESSL